MLLTLNKFPLHYLLICLPSASSVFQVIIGCIPSTYRSPISSKKEISNSSLIELCTFLQKLTTKKVYFLLGISIRSVFLYLPVHVNVIFSNFLAKLGNQVYRIVQCTYIEDS